MHHATAGRSLRNWVLWPGHVRRRRLHRVLARHRVSGDRPVGPLADDKELIGLIEDDQRPLARRRLVCQPDQLSKRLEPANYFRIEPWPHRVGNSPARERTSSALI